MRDEKNKEVVGKKETGNRIKEVHRNEREKKEKRSNYKGEEKKGLSSGYERIWNSVLSKFGCRGYFIVHLISRGLRVCLVR
jgi:hypothetical protein